MGRGGTLTKLWRSGSVDEVLGQSAFVPVVLGQQLSELQSILLVSALLLLLGHVPIEPIAGNKTIGDVQRLRAHRSVWSAPRQILHILPDKSSGHYLDVEDGKGDRLTFAGFPQVIDPKPCLARLSYLEAALLL